MNGSSTSTARSFAIVLAAAAFLTACSSSSSSTVATGTSAVPTSAAPSSVAATDAATYMESLCTSIDTWQTSIKDGNTTFQDAISAPGTTPQAVKDALDTYLTSAVQDTQTMADEVEALGTPAVDGGDQAASTVVGALNDVATLFQGALDTVQGVDVTNPAAMGTALADLATKVQQGSKDITDALGTLEGGELATVAADIPACQSIG